MKIKKLKQSKYKRDETGQGVDILNGNIMKSFLGISTPPVVVESLSITMHHHEFGLDDIIQGVGDSDTTNEPNPESSSSSTSSVTKPSTDTNETQKPDEKSRKQQMDLDAQLRCENRQFRRYR